MDLPGYGYARVTPAEKEKWGKMIENYLHKSQMLRCVFLLIDIRHEPSSNDKLMYDWIVSQGFQPILIATKADKIPRGKWNKHESAIKKKLQFEANDRFIIFSSETRQGYDQAWDAIVESIL